MKEILKKARAKVNLRLKFEGRREDGYHLLSMVNATISLADEIIIKKKSRRGITFSVDGPLREEVPANPSNSCHKAAKLFCETAKIDDGLVLLLIKNIPSQAGLGGGSSDAAATLLALNELYQLNIDLIPLAQRLGSDVPFFLHGGLQYVSGIGEDLLPLTSNDLFGEPLQLIVPSEKISTQQAYEEVRTKGIEMHIDRLGRGFAQKGRASYAEIVGIIDNDFLPIALALAPSIQSAFSQEEMSIASLTGSGSCCFRMGKYLGQSLPFRPHTEEEGLSVISCTFEK